MGNTGLDDPLPAGEVLIGSDGTEIRVLGIIPDARRQVAEENSFNDSPEEGMRFYMIRLEVVYPADASGSVNVAAWDFSLIGDNRVVYGGLVNSISRSSVYYPPRAPSQKDLALMKQIDQQYLATPFYWSRRMKVWLGRQGHWVNRKRVQSLMRTLGLQVIYRRPRTSKPAPGHKVYPYLLGGMEITGPNQVWAADIIYIPMARGFLYLVAIMDWYSRYVVAWRLSNTLDADFCVETLEEALGKGKPDVFNTDQGSPFTSQGFTELLEEHGGSISMDGKGRYTDNIFVERLWRTVKYEEVYLKAYSNGREVKDGLEAYFHFYNTQRPQQALGYRTPAEVFSGDSVQSDEQSKERRWPPSRALVYLGKTAGPSLNIAPMLSN